MTQQYTPVSWQDETTSQQGTLINAERLNQMQTAHHYADGLEEVDTVPTADPGVAYHKIVYCTADSTIYRWDGEAWTADIDDPTRELLEEHEADHDNPHQVTKSQVGLGNADNTSDLNKPISTATQTALNAKADKSDTYTKAQVDTALATKADKATTYTKTETDTLLGAKADKSTTYTKSETDTLLGGKADTATTLAGYGITDAYTKTEADTLLGAKADQATTYTKGETDTLLAGKANASQLTDGSVTKVGTSNVGDDTKPIKLVAGVPTAVTYDLAKDSEVVHLARAETIPGAKTFTANRGVALKATQFYNTFEVSSKGFTNNIEAKAYTSDGSASDQHFVIGTSYSNASREVWHAIAYAPRVTRGDASETQTEMRLSMNINNNNTGEAYFSFGRNDGVSAPDLVLGKFANGAWTPTMVNDALDAYTPMVRTTGNQSISGTKIFSGDVGITGAFNNKCKYYGYVSAAANYEKIATLTPGTLGGAFVGMIYSTKGQTNEFKNRHGIFYARVRNTDLQIIWMMKGSSIVEKQLYLTYDGSKFELWGLVNYDAANEAMGFNLISESNAGTIPYNLVTINTDDIVKTEAELSQYQLSTYSQ